MKLKVPLRRLKLAKKVAKGQARREVMSLARKGRRK